MMSPDDAIKITIEAMKKMHMTDVPSPMRFK